MPKTHWTESDDPRAFQRGLYGSLWAWAIGLFVLIMVLTVAAWQLGWIFKAENVERQVRIDNSNTGTQTAWHDEAVKTIADFELVSEDNSAARGALRTKACGLIARLSDPYRDDIIVRFDNKECQ